jgi:hypothetical protein
MAHRKTRWPILQMTFDCPSQLVAGDRDLTITSRLTYVGVTGGSENNNKAENREEARAEAQPIVFHTADFYGPKPFALFGRHLSPPQADGSYTDEDQWWQELGSDDDAIGASAIVDLPPIRVNISGTAKDSYFTELHPGQSWERHHKLRDLLGREHGELRAGSKLQFVFCGAEIDWWDWGSMEDHTDTHVWLTNNIWGPVLQEPGSADVTSDTCPWTDNGGRPKLVVQSAEIDIAVA